MHHILDGVAYISFRFSNWVSNNYFSFSKFLFNIMFLKKKKFHSKIGSFCRFFTSTK